MKTSSTVLALASLLLGGCGGAQHVSAPSEPLEIVSMTPLPPITLMRYSVGMKLNFLVHVLADGTVENVRLLGSSGDAVWDSLALQAIKQWRYAPPRRDGLPADHWYRQPVVVRLQAPVVMTIGTLATATLREADSLYTLLQEGVDLDTLFMTSIGTFDIGKYPPEVRYRLKKLAVGDYTSPLPTGEKYVIYKRFREGGF